MVYDMNTKSVIRPDYNLKDISITRFKPLNDKELLIATDGGGVHKINMGSSSNLVVNSLSLYFQVNNYPFLLTFIRKYRH